MNFKEMARNAGLSEEEFLDIAGVFVDVTIADLSRLKAAIADGAIAEVVEAAHSIKGSAVNFGFEKLRNHAREIEVKARQGTLDGALDDLRLLEENLRYIIAELDARGREGVP